MKKKLITALVTLVMCGRLITPIVATADNLDGIKSVPYVGYEPGDEGYLEIKSTLIYHSGYRFNLIIREGRHAYDIVAVDEIRIISRDAQDILFYNRLPLIFEITNTVRHQQGSFPMYDSQLLQSDGKCTQPIQIELASDSKPVIISPGTIYAHWESTNTRAFIEEYTPELTGDVDGDGDITARDVRYLLKYYTYNKVAGLNMTWNQILGKEDS